MQKRVCPICGLPQYSAAAEQAWRCPRCGAVPLAEEENRYCIYCKSTMPLFAKFCDGTGPEWTIAKCEAARAEARNRWKEAAWMGRR
jgi:ribosomal protein S27AE